MKKLFTLFFFQALCCYAAHAQSTWTGATSSNWFTATNWSPSGVPSASTAVTIPGSLATYPTLTANATVGTLTMTGGALHLGGYTFSSGGGVSISTATIDGGGTCNISGAGSVYIISSTFTTALSVTGYTGTCQFFSNTITGNTTIADAAAQNSGLNYIDGNFITGNLTLTHASATDDMLEGYGAASGNHVTGNAAINLTGAGGFYSSYSHGLLVDGNLTVNRSVAGATSIFRTAASAGVGGNFFFTTAGGITELNPQSSGVVTVGGTFSLNATLAGASFRMHQMKNAISGGTVSISGSGSQYIQSDTLKADVSITGYINLSSILDNSFTGTTIISDAAPQTSGSNYIDGNLFTGNLTLTHASATDDMYEGYGSPSGNGNRITGNATYNITGAGAFYSSYSHGIRVNGNFTVNRSVAGSTYLFGNPTASIGGNFSYTTAGGRSDLNTGNTVVVPIGGTINLSSPATSYFRMYKLKNAVAGGTVSVAASSNMVVQNDTLLAVINITGYTNYATILDNSFTGATTISDDPSQNSGSNYIDGNLFAGNLSLTHASATDDMYEGYGSPTGNRNRVTGNATITISGAGRFFGAYDHGTRVDGNLTVNRTVSGYTSLFRNAATTGSVSGNFSYTTAGGDSRLNETNTSVTLIGGTFNISSPASGLFYMYKVKNGAAGGSVSVIGSGNLDVRNDTLLSNVSITGYTNAAYIYDNAFTGTTSIADAATQNSGANYIDGNLFTGNFTLTHNSATDNMLEGYSSPSGNGNRVTGDATFIIPGAGNFYGSYDHGIQVGGNFLVNRLTAGYTNLFHSSTQPANIAGNFTLNANFPNNTYLNDGNPADILIGGTINISTNGAGEFHMHHLKNATLGGTVSITGSSNLDLRYDSLRATVNALAFTGPCYIWDNAIYGTATITNTALQNTGTDYIDGNFITGNLLVTHASNSDQMAEGYGSPNGFPNRVLGSASFSLTGTGTFISSYNHSLRVGGNLSITRSTTGGSATHLYYSGATAGSVDGNFSLNLSSGNNCYINVNGSPVATVSGAININAPQAGQFQMWRMKSLSPGGVVDISGASNLDLRWDTLRANVRLTRYVNACNIFDNTFTGATLIADSSIQNSGSNYIDGNRFAGNLTLIHNSTTDGMTEGYGSPSGNPNTVAGIDSIVKAPGSAGVTLSYSHTHRADSDFVMNAPAGSINMSSIAFGGSTNGHLRQAGAQYPGFADVYLSKTGSAKLFLDTALGVTNSLTFTSGYIVSNTAHPLVFANGASYTGAGNASHVKGQVMKVGNTAFTFPTGDGTFYSPAGITAPAATTDSFSAQYFRQAPQSAGYDTTLHDPSINHVSRSEYWLVNRGFSSTSGVKVILGFNAHSGVTDLSKLTLAHWYNNGTSTAWHDEGKGGTTGGAGGGTLTSNNTVTTFSPFTIASTTAANPLPLKLTEFWAKAAGNTASVNWKTEGEAGITSYIVQRSTDAASFSDLGAVATKGSGTVYSFSDAAPADGYNYYRLAIVEMDGGISYSAVQRLHFGKAATEVSVYPNPASDVVNIDGLQSHSGAVMTIRNISGQLLQRSVLAGEPTVSIPLREWPAGMYLLQIRDADGSTLRSTFMRR